MKKPRFIEVKSVSQGIQLRARVNIYRQNYVSPNSVQFLLHHTVLKHQTKKIGKGAQRVNTKQTLGSISVLSRLYSTPANGAQGVTLGPTFINLAAALS